MMWGITAMAAAVKDASAVAIKEAPRIGTETGTMRAFVIAGIGETALAEKPIPIPGPDEAVVRTTAALICTSDVHTVRGAIPVPAGRTLGHESVGVIASLGSAVDGFEIGERVAVGAVTPCFRCDYCQRGFTSQCHGMLGGYNYTARMDGNMAEYFIVPAAAANLTRIPDAIPDEKAVYVCDMLSTGFVGVENAELELGETVAVFAQGPVGLASTIGCRLVGAGYIIAVEGIKQRQDLALHFGADVIVDPGTGDSVEQILELTGGKGVDAAIEAYGFPETFEAAIRATKPGGRISNIGYHGENPAPLLIPLEPFGMGMSDKSIRTGLCPGGSERLGRLLRLMETGRVDPTPMTTHEFWFAEIEKAFAMMAAKSDGIIKPLIRFA
jgi:threonine dehydrogenase-like Zn-dependent dehydrogenase